MSDRFPSSSGSLSPADPAGLWTASYCAPCPARSLCAAVDTDSACGSPAEYPQASAHPEHLAATADGSDFELPAFQSVDSTSTLTRTPLLIVSDGNLTPNVKLQHLLAAVRGTTGRSHTGKLAVLHGSDRHLYGLLRRRGRLGERLTSAGFVGAIAPGFSTWESHPPFEALLAQGLSARVATELDRVIPTVPTVVWRTHEELQRWSSWIHQNDRASIALHPGPLRTGSEWEWWTRGLGILRELAASRDLHIFVNGPCTRDRMGDVVRIWGPEVTFMTQHPWAAAMKGKVIDPEDFSKTLPDPDERTAADRLRDNESAIRSYVDELIVAAMTIEGSSAS